MDRSITSIFLVFIFSAKAMTQQIKLSRYLPLDGKNMTAAVISKSKDNIAADCARHCVDSATCQSFFFNPLTGQCQYHELVFISPGGATDQEGMHYYYIIREINDWCQLEKGFQLLSEDGPCVKFHTDIKNWYEANQTCASYSPYSRLVVLDNQVKTNLVKAAAMAISDQFNNPIWIGLSEVTQDVYRWVDGGDVDFSDWSPDDFSDENTYECVVLHRVKDFIWEKEACTRKRHYICEVHLDIDQYHTMMNRHF